MSVDAALERTPWLTRLTEKMELPELGLYTEMPSRWRGARGEILEISRGDGLTGAELTLTHATPEEAGFGPPKGP